MIINKQTTKTITDVRSFEEKKKTSFFRALDAISFKSSEFCHLNLKHPDFKLTIKYPRNNFINDIQQIIENIDKNDSEKIWDLVGCIISVSAVLVVFRLVNSVMNLAFSVNKVVIML